MRLGAAALVALPILVSISPAFASEPHPTGQIPGLADARAAYRSLPLSFEPNRGQSDPRVKFMSRSQGLTLFLTSTDAVLVTREASLKMRVLGANPDAVVQGLDARPGRIHSLIGRDPSKWQTDGRAYARVLYREIYPGIDLAYYGTRGQGLEYDFVVAPGANPRAIRLGFEGADRIELSAEGDLLLHVGAASLRFGKPMVYQHVGGARREIQGGWVRDGAATIGFQIAAYDPSMALVIDPIVSVATYLGGFGTDQAFAVAVDAAGAVYVTGNTTSLNFPTTAGSFAPTPLGGTEAFVVKLSHDLSTTVYSTFLGGTGDDAGRDIAVDAGGNAYVTGFTNSTDFPTTPGAFQTAPGGGVCSGVPCNDAFVVKLNPTGDTLLYATYLGGNGSDVGLGIAVDGAGNAHVTGGTFSTNFPTTANAVQPTATAGGSREAFVTKLNVLGSALEYSTFLGGTGDDVGNAIALSGRGVAYVTGTTASPTFPVTLGSVQTGFGGPAGGTDAFVTALSTGGALIYSTFLGGIASDEGLSITIDGSGNAYVTGATSSQNFPATGVFTFTGTTTQAFLTELNPTGAALVVSRAVPTGRLDTTARDPGSPSISVGIARDGIGNIFVSGSELRTAGGVTVNTDAFVVSLDSTATSTTTQFVGGTGDDFGLGLAVDVTGNVFLVGDTSSADFPVTASAVQTTFGGTTDAFVVMITQPGIIASGGGGHSSTCVIATAAFGSPMAREVGVLREFRDDVLLPHAAGRAAVAAYYTIGPPLAGVIAQSETLKAVVRASLAPMIWLAPLARGRATLAFYVVIGAGSLLAGLLGVAPAARRARLGRRGALAATFVTALLIGSGIALLDLSDHQRSDFASTQSRPAPAVSAPAVDRGPAPPRAAGTAAGEDARPVPGIRVVGADRYQVALGASGGSMPDLARIVTVRPTLAGFQIMSDIGDGILTADGLLVTNPKLAALAGIEAGDRILAINGHPPAGGFFLAVVKLRRDPDSGTVRVAVDRAGTRIEKTVVMR
jgi:beta-propeller repeat-containing protein